MKVCKKCIQPDTRPKVYFNEEGICGACLWEEEKKSIDWGSREKELLDIVKWAKKNTKSNYDCVIGVSGGKDSTFQAITARDKLGLRCLLVNGEPDGITELGKQNIENLKNLGFDVISLRPNPKIMKRMMRRDFYKYLNPQKITEYALYSSAYIIADQFNIPLIIQGENGALTLGVTLTGLGTDGNALRVNESNTLKTGWEEYLEDNDLEEKDLFMYHYNRKSLEKKEYKAIWIQYYLKEWSFFHNAEFALKYGFKGHPDEFDLTTIGTFVPYAQIDSDLTQVSQMLKNIKFGFGHANDHACYAIRDGRMTREEGLELVKKYDGKCADIYVKKLCDHLEIPIEEFWSVAEKFRGNMWEKDHSGNWKNTYWNYVNN